MSQLVDTIDTELSSSLNSTMANLFFGGKVILAMLADSRAGNGLESTIGAVVDRWRTMVFLATDGTTSCRQFLSDAI